MIISEQSLIAWKVIITILHVFAILTSVLRIWFRYRRGRMWMDDWMAVPPLFMDILNVVIMWLLYVDHGKDPKLRNRVALL
ncbi:hypothetical protein BJ165DRAFT_1419875 [Panaeolus papilionaceus]|nr:hypothetical protein BJ165DRAFT_1419875 [Panaeolus papilionaceus]